MSDGTCIACGSHAKNEIYRSKDYNPHRRRAFLCNSYNAYGYRCDSCGTTFHDSNKIYYGYEIRCPNCYETSNIMHNEYAVDFEYEEIEKREREERVQKEKEQREKLEEAYREELRVKKYQQKIYNQQIEKQNYYKKRLLLFGWIPTITWSLSEADIYLRNIYNNESFLKYIFYCACFFITNTTDAYRTRLEYFPSFTLKLNYFIGLAGFIIMGGILFLVGMVLLYIVGIILQLFN